MELPEDKAQLGLAVAIDLTHRQSLEKCCLTKGMGQRDVPKWRMDEKQCQWTNSAISKDTRLMIWHIGRLLQDHHGLGDRRKARVAVYGRANAKNLLWYDCEAALWDSEVVKECSRQIQYKFALTELGIFDWMDYAVLAAIQLPWVTPHPRLYKQAMAIVRCLTPKLHDALLAWQQQQGVEIETGPESALWFACDAAVHLKFSLGSWETTLKQANFKCLSHSQLPLLTKPRNASPGFSLLNLVETGVIRDFRPEPLGESKRNGTLGWRFSKTPNKATTWSDNNKFLTAVLHRLNKLHRYCGPQTRGDYHDNVVKAEVAETLERIKVPVIPKRKGARPGRVSVRNLGRVSVRNLG